MRILKKQTCWLSSVEILALSLEQKKKKKLWVHFSKLCHNIFQSLTNFKNIMSTCCKVWEAHRTILWSR